MLVSSSPLVGGAASLSLDRDTESSFSLEITNELLLIFFWENRIHSDLIKTS